MLNATFLTIFKHFEPPLSFAWDILPIFGTQWLWPLLATPKADVFMGKTLVLLSLPRCPLFHGSIRLTGALFLGDANRYITGCIRRSTTVDTHSRQQQNPSCFALAKGCTQHRTVFCCASNPFFAQFVIVYICYSIYSPIPRIHYHLFQTIIHHSLVLF